MVGASSTQVLVATVPFRVSSDLVAVEFGLFEPARLLIQQGVLRMDGAVEARSAFDPGGCVSTLNPHIQLVNVIAAQMNLERVTIGVLCGPQALQRSRMIWHDVQGGCELACVAQVFGEFEGSFVREFGPIGMPMNLLGRIATSEVVTTLDGVDLSSFLDLFMAASSLMVEGRTDLKFCFLDTDLPFIMRCVTPSEDMIASVWNFLSNEVEDSYRVLAQPVGRWDPEGHHIVYEFTLV